MFSKIPLEKEQPKTKSKINRPHDPFIWTALVYIIAFFLNFIYLAFRHQSSKLTTVEFQPFHRMHSYTECYFNFGIAPIKNLRKFLQINVSVVRPFSEYNETMNVLMNMKKIYSKTKELIIKDNFSLFFEPDERISVPYTLINDQLTYGDSFDVQVSFYGNLFNATGMRFEYSQPDTDTNIYTRNLRIYSLLLVIYPVFAEFSNLFSHENSRPYMIIYGLYLIFTLLNSNPMAYFVEIINSKEIDLFLQFIYNFMLVFVETSLIFNFKRIIFKEHLKLIVFSEIYSLILNILHLIPRISCPYVNLLPADLNFNTIMKVLNIILILLVIIGLIIYPTKYQPHNNTLTYISVAIFHFVFKLFIFSFLTSDFVSVSSLIVSSLDFANNLVCGSALIFINFLIHKFDEKYDDFDYVIEFNSLEVALEANSNELSEE